METKSKQKNVAEQVTSSHREQRLVLLSSVESQRAIKWARDHAEELEKFHRREGEYYSELPRSADDHGNAELYAKLKRAMEALLEQNVKEHAPLSAGASVDHGVEVESTEDHENRAADRGCVTRLVRNSSDCIRVKDVIRSAETNWSGPEAEVWIEDPDGNNYQVRKFIGGPQSPMILSAMPYVSSSGKI